MKNLLGLFCFIISSNTCFGQNITQTDSIGIEICNSTKMNSNLSDIQILSLIDEEHIAPYIKR